MRSLLFALLSLASIASAAPVCREPSTLPFPLPSDEVSADWGDAEFEEWEAAQWARYCGKRATSRECVCAKARGAF